MPTNAVGSPTRPAEADDDGLVRRQMVSAWAAIAGLSALCAAAVLWYPSHLERSSASGAEARRKVRLGVEPNSATWFELAQLPGIGPSLARRIVDHREATRARLGKERQVFVRPADLRQVKGLGQKKVERIGRLLWFEDRPGGG